MKLKLNILGNSTRYLSILICALSVSLFGALFYSGSANAWTTDPLPACSISNLDVAIQEIRELPGYNSESGVIIFMRDWSGPPWSGAPAVMFTGYNTGNDYLYFHDYGGQFAIHETHGGVVRYGIDGNGELYPVQGGTVSGSEWTDINCISAVQNIPYGTDNYPYTGSTNYPESFDPPLTWTPDINHVQSIDWKIKLQDRNFNTFDPVPFTCDQGLAPIIQYDLYNNDIDPNTPIDQGVFSPTIQYEFQAEDYGIETEFKFIGNYYCGSGEDEPTFSGQTTYYFTLNAIGTFVPDTPSCFSETFPYVDMDGCTAVIENLVNNLSFGAITFPDWEVNSDGCHTLEPLGDWINVAPSSRTICPQFSSTVRNTVTPFLTFVLGITIIGALISKTRLDSH